MTENGTCKYTEELEGHNLFTSSERNKLKDKEELTCCLESLIV